MSDIVKGLRLSGTHVNEIINVVYPVGYMGPALTIEAGANCHHCMFLGLVEGVPEPELRIEAMESMSSRPNWLDDVAGTGHPVPDPYVYGPCPKCGGAQTLIDRTELVDLYQCTKCYQVSKLDRVTGDQTILSPTA